MFWMLLLAAQTPEMPSPDLLDQPPAGEEVRAAERRAARQVPVIVRICRNAMQAGDPDELVKAFADRNGLSSYGRVSLSVQCRIYRQGVADGEVRPRSRAR